MPRQKQLWKDKCLPYLGTLIMASTLWVADRNAEDIDLESVGVHDETQVFLWRACRKHLMFQSFKSVTDNFFKGKKYGTSLNCKVCCFYNDILVGCKTQEPSQWEEAAYHIMKKSSLAPVDWIVDAKVLQNSNSKADIWIVDLHLIFMVDGEQHFFDSHDRPVAEQEERDDVFNGAAISEGFCVMRLHYRDKDLYPTLMAGTIAECQKKDVKPFVNWSPAFKSAKWTL